MQKTQPSGLCVIRKFTNWNRETLDVCSSVFVSVYIQHFQNAEWNILQWITGTGTPSGERNDKPLFLAQEGCEFRPLEQRDDGRFCRKWPVVSLFIWVDIAPSFMFVSIDFDSYSSEFLLFSWLSSLTWKKTIETFQFDLLQSLSSNIMKA